MSNLPIDGLEIFASLLMQLTATGADMQEVKWELSYTDIVDEAQHSQRREMHLGEVREPTKPLSWSNFAVVLIFSVM